MQVSCACIALQYCRTLSGFSFTFAFFLLRNCQLISMTLNEVGFENVALHAMERQRERLAALAKFKSNVVRILIATDVASRGMYKQLWY